LDGRIWNPPLRGRTAFRQPCRGRCPHRPVCPSSVSAVGRATFPQGKAELAPSLRELPSGCEAEGVARPLSHSLRLPFGQPPPSKREALDGRIWNPPLRGKTAFRQSCRGRCPHRPVCPSSVSAVGGATFPQGKAELAPSLRELPSGCEAEGVARPLSHSLRLPFGQPPPS